MQSGLSMVYKIMQRVRNHFFLLKSCGFRTGSTHKGNVEVEFINCPSCIKHFKDVISISPYHSSMR